MTSLHLWLLHTNDVTTPMTSIYQWLRNTNDFTTPTTSLRKWLHYTNDFTTLVITLRGVYRYGKSYRYAYLYRIVVPVFCTGIPCCCRSQPCRHLPFTSCPISFSRPPFMLQSGLAWKKPDRPEWRSKNRRSWVSWHIDYCFFLLIVLTSDTPKYCRRRTFINLWRHSYLCLVCILSKKNKTKKAKKKTKNW